MLLATDEYNGTETDDLKRAVKLVDVIAGGLTTVRFDLLTNPFAVLGLTEEAGAGIVTARARELGTPEASAAARLLLIPRSRLQAELRYLPGAPDALAHATLEALKSGVTPDLLDLGPLALANVLAYLAASRYAAATHLGSLAELQDLIRSTAAATVGAARVHARLPPVNGDMLDEALADLATEHANAFTDGLLAISNGAEFLTEQLQAVGGEVGARASFVREAVVAWERATAGDSARDLESGETIEAEVRSCPTLDLVRRLEAIIQQYATRTRPPREASRSLGIVHKSSADAVRRWLGLAVDLNNEHDAATEAVVLLEALADGFDTIDEVGTLVARDLKTCRERLARGDGTPEIRRLRLALDASQAAREAFTNPAMIEGTPTSLTPSAVRELHDAFVAAAQIAPFELPWRMMRTFTLRLQNESSATAAAMAFTQLAIRMAACLPAKAEAARVFSDDLRALRREEAKAQLDVALRSKSSRLAKQILATLIPLLDDPDEIAEYRRLQANVTSRQATPTAWYGLLAVVALLAVIAVQNGNLSQWRSAGVSGPATNAISSGQGFTPPYASTPSPPVDTDAGRPERQPAAGETPLNRAELRWCEFQKARADGASAYIDAIRRSMSGASAGRFNAAVDVYNRVIAGLSSSCRDRSYWGSDKTVIDSEILQRETDLKAEGKALVAAAYERTSFPTAQVPAYGDATNPSAQPPPSSYGSPSFSQGLSDRQIWETWVSGLAGGFRDGVEWWASVRSTAGPPPCKDAPGPDRLGVVSGCNAAKARLTPCDARRSGDPEYRAGWNSLVVPPSESRAFQQGVADRQAWEVWFADTAGTYRDGAEWWSAVRSSARPRACNDVPGDDRAGVVAGCNAARARLAGPDRRRRAEPDYRAGWNSL